jgi:hypothetical protein
MKGRLYDPKIGRFPTPDRVVPRPHFGQSWNPYSYVLNNPLAYVDPTGFQDESPSGQNLSSVPTVIKDDGKSCPNPCEVVVRGEHVVRGSRESVEVGATTVSIDVNIYGNTAGFVPQPTVSATEQGAQNTAGDAMLGVAEGASELAVNVATFTVLNAMTFGGYGAYQFGRAMWDGYKENGVLGALNAVNPLYQLARGGADTYLAVERGDYRAAAAAGTTTAILAAATVYGAGKGLGALTAESTAAETVAVRAARGGAEVAERGIVAANGTKITGFTGHAVDRAIGDGAKRAGVSPQAILDALKNPLKIGEVRIDNLGRQSQRFIGPNAEVVVNPQTGKIVSINPTSSSKAARLGGE